MKILTNFRLMGVVVGAGCALVLFTGPSNVQLSKFVRPLALAVSLFAPAHALAQASVEAKGKVIAVTPEKQEVVLEHGEIKGFMEAMTMGYKVNSPSLLKGLKSGDEVQFTIDKNKSVITKISKIKN